jgi:hypothetical protein
MVLRNQQNQVKIGVTFCKPREISQFLANAFISSKYDICLWHFC